MNLHYKHHQREHRSPCSFASQPTACTAKHFTKQECSQGIASYLPAPSEGRPAQGGLLLLCFTCWGNCRGWARRRCSNSKLRQRTDQKQLFFPAHPQPSGSHGRLSVALLYETPHNPMTTSSTRTELSHPKAKMSSVQMPPPSPSPHWCWLQAGATTQKQSGWEGWEPRHGRTQHAGSADKDICHQN